MALFRGAVQGTACGKNCMVFTAMTLQGRDVTDATVFVLRVVPMHKCSTPLPRSLQRCNAFDTELRAVLGRAKQRLPIGIVITHPRA